MPMKLRFTNQTKFIVSVAVVVLVMDYTKDVYGQNIAVNSTGASANTKAILDLTAPDKGLLIPRVVLNSNTDPISGTKPVGLMVYNNGGSFGSSGFYYWTGGTWATFSNMPTGTSGQTMRYDGSDWVATSTLYNNGSNIGIATSSPNAVLNIYEPGESTTKTNFTQSLGDAGLLISTNYTDGAYTPGVFWSTNNNNSTLPKAGIYLQETDAGSKMFLATSTNYSQGLTNDGIVIDDMGNVGMGTTVPTAQLHTTGSVKFASLAGGGDKFLTVDNNGNLTSTPMGSSGQMMMANGSFVPVGTNAIENQTASNQSGSFRISGNGIFNGGSVGIGTTSPSYSLHVAGTAGFDRYLFHNGDANTYLQFEADEVRMYAGGRDFLRLIEGSTDMLVVNESSSDIDFRVKSDGDDNALFVEGSTNRVAIGTNNPSKKLHVQGDMRVTDLAGSGTRMVVADANGDLSTQAIPSGGNGSGWSMSGNTIGNNDYLGTTNNKPLTLKVNNQDAGVIDGQDKNTFLGYQVSYSGGGNNNIGIGNSAEVSGGGSNSYNIAIGDQTQIQSSYSIAIGRNTNINQQYAISIGDQTQAQGNSAIVIGKSAYANSSNGITMGTSSQSQGTSSITIGHSAYSNGSNSLTIGTSSQAQGISSITLGHNSYTSGSNSIAIGGGSSSTQAQGTNSISMGYRAYSSSTNSIAIGYHAQAQGSNCITIGTDFYNGTSNTVAIGNSSVNTTKLHGASSNSYALIVGTGSSNGNGAYLTKGGTWTNTSDVNRKEDITKLDKNEILERVSNLDITRWKYKGTDEYHIGPMAQDFYNQFSLGVNNTSISTIDPAGVALVSIQALNEKVNAQEQVILELKKEIEDLKKSTR